MWASCWLSASDRTRGPGLRDMATSHVLQCSNTSRLVERTLLIGLHGRVALLKRFTQLGRPTTVPVVAVGQLRLGLGSTRSAFDLCNKAGFTQAQRSNPMISPSRTRRHYLAIALSAASVAAVGRWPWHAEMGMGVAADGAQANLLCLVPQSQAAAVGAAVLAQLANPTPQALVQTLVSRLSGFLDGDLHQVCDTAQLHLAFQKAVQDDFAQGRCVSVSGWVLARIEVEICAFAALSADSA